MDERRRVSRKQEKRVAQRFGAQQHAGSGSGYKKHDSHNESLLIECKTTVGNKKQITIKGDDLQSVEHAALLQGRTPVLMFDVAGRSYGVMTEDDIFEREQELHRWRSGGSSGS